MKSFSGQQAILLDQECEFELDSKAMRLVEVCETHDNIHTSNIFPTYVVSVGLGMILWLIFFLRTHSFNLFKVLSKCFEAVVSSIKRLVETFIFGNKHDILYSR